MLDSLAVITTPFFTPEECQDIISYCVKKEESLQDSSSDYGIVSSNQVTTSNFDKYNFFLDNQQYIPRLTDIISDTLPWLTKPLLVQSWVNIYRTGEGIKWHNHAGLHDHSYTANIFIGGDTNPGLAICEPGNGQAVVPNKLGEMMILNCCLFHSVAPIKSSIPRYTIGMTIHDYYAITPEILSQAAINSNQCQMLIQ